MPDRAQDPAAIIDLVNEIEGRFDVVSWTIDGLHVWPLVRLRIGFGLIDAFAPETRWSASGGRLDALTERARWLRSLGAGLAARRSARRRDPSREPSRGQVAAVFLGSGMSMIDAGGAWYERVCDPIADCLEERGERSRLLLLSHVYRTPRHRASSFVQSQLDFAAARAALGRRRSPGSTSLGGFDDLLEWFQALHLQLTLPTPGQLAADVRTLRAQAAIFDRELRDARPRVAFVVGYHGGPGMAFTLACRTLGIPCVDVQHGIQSPLHVGYAGWAAVPSAGYEVMPQIYWCWDADDASTISAWADGCRSTAFVGGNPFLERWRAGRVPGAAAARSRVLAVTEQDPKRVDVLWTVPPTLRSTEHVEMMVSAMLRTADQCRWWVRLHPSMEGQREEIRSLVSSVPSSAIEIDEANDLPLHAVLERMGFHVTHSSSVVVEAEAFHVRSIVTSQYGAAFMERSLAEGRTVLATTLDEVVSALRQPAGAPSSGPEPDSCRGLDALEQVLADR